VQRRHLTQTMGADNEYLDGKVNLRCSIHERIGDRQRVCIPTVSRLILDRNNSESGSETIAILNQVVSGGSADLLLERNAESPVHEIIAGSTDDDNR
jgi:hypothetical protein